MRWLASACAVVCAAALVWVVCQSLYLWAFLTVVFALLEIAGGGV